jgi:autoinducer-2 kinase
LTGKPLLLAIDAGTGSTRAVVFSADGKQLAASGQEWRHRQIDGVPGSMEFDTATNWDTILRCITDALAGLDATDVVAVSATSMREGIITFDDAGDEVWGVANVDSRATDEVVRLKSAGVEPFIYARSGQTLALAAQPRLAWLQAHRPRDFERVAAVAMLSDWVIARLSGVIRSEPSNGSTSGLMSLETRDFDPELADRCGLPRDILPEVAEPGTVVGTLLPEVASVTGMRPDTLVVIGGGDAQIATTALGVVRPGSAAVIGGSFWQQEVNLSRPEVDPAMRIRVNCHAIPQTWQAEGIVFFPGLAVRWFRDAFYPDLVAEAKRRGSDPYDLIASEAEHVPAGSNGILPIFSDEMHYERWEHAAPSFLDFGIDPTAFSRATFFRALMENAAIVTRANLEAIGEFSGTRPDSVVFAGGAAKSSLWTQIVADVLGVSVRVPVVKEASALGGALCAAAGAGIYPDLASAAGNLVSWEREFTPRRDHAAVYQELTERWRAAYASQLELARTGVTTPMWRAPGA